MELYFEPLTVLIGTNASEKSNLVEALFCIVIEEIDNGLHLSHAELLVKILREIGTNAKLIC